jgi:predicted aldo/keto reductase-like oxidoreductase
MSKRNRPKKFSRWYQWLNDNKITALEITIRYATATSEISKVLVGVDTKEQLQEIVELSKGKGALPALPKELFTNDVNLFNPSN